MKELPARQIIVLYWQHSQKSYHFNDFTDKIKELVEEYIDEPMRQKGYDFRMININRAANDYPAHTRTIEKFRGQKLRFYPLVILDQGKDFMVVNSSSRLKELERIFKHIYEYYFH